MAIDLSILSSPEFMTMAQGQSQMGQDSAMNPPVQLGGGMQQQGQPQGVLPPQINQQTILKDQARQYLEEQIAAIRAQRENSQPTAQPSGVPNNGQLLGGAGAILLASLLGDKKGEFAAGLVPSLMQSTKQRQGAEYQTKEAGRMAKVGDAQAEEEIAQLRIQDVGRQLQELQTQEFKAEDRKLKEQAIIERTLDKDMDPDLIKASLLQQGVKISPEVTKLLDAYGTQRQAKIASEQDLKKRELSRRTMQNALSIWERATSDKVRIHAAADVAREYARYKDEFPPGYESYINDIFEDAKKATPDQKKVEQETATSKERAETEDERQKLFRSQVLDGASRRGLNEKQGAKIVEETKWIAPKYALQAANTMSLIEERKKKPVPGTSEGRLQAAEERKSTMDSIRALQSRQKEITDPLLPGQPTKGYEQEFKANDAAIQKMIAGVRDMQAGPEADYKRAVNEVQRRLNAKEITPAEANDMWKELKRRAGKG